MKINRHRNAYLKQQGCAGIDYKTDQDLARYNHCNKDIRCCVSLNYTVSNKLSEVTGVQRFNQGGETAPFDQYHSYQFPLELLPFQCSEHSNQMLSSQTVICRNNPDIHYKLNTVFTNQKFKSKTTQYIRHLCGIMLGFNHILKECLGLRRSSLFLLLIIYSVAKLLLSTFMPNPV